MSTFSRTYQVLFLATLSFFAACAAYGFVLFSFQAEAAAHESLASAIATAKVREGKLSVANEELKTTSDRIAKLDRYIVNRESIADFIESIEGLAAVSGTLLRVTSVSVLSSADKQSSPAFVEFVSFAIEAEGSWSELQHLGMLIENVPFQVSVTEVELHPADFSKGDSEWVSNTRFTISTTR